MSVARTAWVGPSPCRPLPPARRRIPPRSWLIVVLVLARSAAAQQEDLTRLSIEDLMDTQVTSVSKKEQSLSRTASAIFVITTDAIRRDQYS
jgi:outer membrane receptor for ferrienterochelin and colicin